MASSGSRILRVIDGGVAPRPAAVAAPVTLDAAFRAHAGFVAGVALRVLGRPSEVDDLVQDVFLRVLPRLGDLREPAALRGWLAVITARLARRRLRSRRWKVWLGMGGEHDYTELADRAASPQDRALLGELYRALDRLPAHHRLAWTLRHVEGMELAAVARACDCSLATVKRWIGAAEAALRMEVDHE
ncbi:MAG TPA: sigma-70 family RNA polymerase sigma factor [Kofleriaceae bacterium]|nr:sigma-70 family RNA polymerase sigma factor [Kofleriaceae bacterium]